MMNYCYNCEHRRRGIIRAARCAAFQHLDPVTGRPDEKDGKLPLCRELRVPNIECDNWQHESISLL